MGCTVYTVLDRVAATPDLPLPATARCSAGVGVHGRTLSYLVPIQSADLQYHNAVCVFEPEVVVQKKRLALCDATMYGREYQNQYRRVAGRLYICTIAGARSDVALGAFVNARDALGFAALATLVGPLGAPDDFALGTHADVLGTATLDALDVVALGVHGIPLGALALRGGALDNQAEELTGAEKWPSPRPWDFWA